MMDKERIEELEKRVAHLEKVVAVALPTISTVGFHALSVYFAVIDGDKERANAAIDAIEDIRKGLELIQQVPKG